MRERFANYKTKTAANICLACGTTAQREFAKYCLVCGKSLSEDYHPLDSLRASNRLPRDLEAKSVETENLYSTDSPRSSVAWAFVVYSMVPYLGILFCPGALIMSGIGMFSAHRDPGKSSPKMAAYTAILSIVILMIQIFLWWLLYIIPELGRKPF